MYVSVNLHSRVRLLCLPLSIYTMEYWLCSMQYLDLDFPGALSGDTRLGAF